MAQSFTAKQQNWIQRFSARVVDLLAANDALVALEAEFSVETYGTGGANALTDATVQGQLPAATAQLIWSSEGAVVSITNTIASNRGYLEPVRP
jgi:hypothetical protein